MGTEDAPFIVNSTADWNDFANYVTGGYTFSGQFVKLNNDISVSNMAGANDANSFQGTFDGDGHKLTVSYNTSSESTAPFRFARNAVIKNLHVDGTIATSTKFAGGIVGKSSGTLTITGCRSSVAINSSVSGDGTHGGIVARIAGGGNTIIIDGCVFDGSFATTASTNNCGGFIGWPVTDKPTIKNSLMKPSSVDAGMLTNTFARWNVTENKQYEPTIDNCYYVATDNLETNQGTEAVANASLDVGSLVQDYGMVKAYTHGIIYNGTYYVDPNMVSGFRLLSTATAQDVGKVVCAAGHLHDAKTEVPGGCTAVGVLGKVTSTGHGLIIALQNATSQSWNTINSWESVTGYAGTTLKLLPDDTARGSLASYASLGVVAVSDWCVAQKSDYEAIFTKLGSTKRDNDGTTYDANVNAYITAAGGTALSDDYWSATESSSPNIAWFFSSNYWYTSSKTSNYLVRPVLGFAASAITVTLADNADNTAFITAADGYLADVTLSGRTLYKDGDWNTICLPFDVDLKATGCPLAGATARYLSEASVSGTTLNLTFSEPVTTLYAGEPYIIKWEKPNPYVEYDGTNAATCSDLVAPAFNGVTIYNNNWNYDTDDDDTNDVTTDQRVRFLGTYKSTAFEGIDNTVLLLGAENKLYYPTTGAGLGAQRAYFKLGDGTALARKLTSFNIDFGDESTGIVTISKESGSEGVASGWFTLDGMKLSQKPTAKGIYVNNERKVVVKK